MYVLKAANIAHAVTRRDDLVGQTNIVQKLSSTGKVAGIIVTIVLFGEGN
jgi:hypothetical protein